MNSTRQVFPLEKDSLFPSVFSDQINDGKSKTTLSSEDSSLSFSCEIILSDIFAFCGIRIPLTNGDNHAINLSNYSLLEIELEYISEHQDSLLIYLNNEEQLLDGEKLERANMWAVSPHTGKNQFVLEPNRFFIPSWWVYLNAPKGVSTEPNIQNVSSLTITTGDNIQARQSEVIIHAINLKGKWIKPETLYIGLLAIWMVLIGARSFVYINNMRNERKKLEALATKDNLTGALNREGASIYFDQVLKLNAVQHRNYSLLILDIDHFKQINDTLGHHQGDLVLKKFVTTCQNNTRKHDLVARWGGEEFVIVLADVDLNNACRFAEKLRKLLAEELVTEEGVITCSIGVAQFEKESIKQWLNRADKALYRAKESGRNKVVKA